MDGEPEVLADNAVANLSARSELVGGALEWLELGGPVATVLLATSVVALAIILAKFWQHGTVRIGSLRAAYDALALYRAGLSREALAVASSSPNPAAAALAHAIRGQQRALPEATAREEVMRYGTAALESLRSGFRILEIIASLAPLLGLFGTVLGMIEAFREMELAGNQVDPTVLSGGIWTALLTTALGLGVAMPVVVMLGWLERRVDRLAHGMGHVVAGIYTVDLSGGSGKEERDESHRLESESAVAGD